MPTLETSSIYQYYELHGDPSSPPVLMVSGLGGLTTDWTPQIAPMSEKYHVILVDQRGTGRTTHAEDGYTTQQLAADMAALVAHLGLGPVHLVGASTGAAIGQYMALDHPESVRSLTMAGAFARFDTFARRGSDVRRRMVAEADRKARYDCYACFLFSPRYTRDHPEKVQDWIDEILAKTESPADRDIHLKRIDMIAAHDTVARLGEIKVPSLVMCGALDVAAPLAHSEEIVSAVPGSRLVVLEDAGHLIELEKAEEFGQIVSTFIDGLQVQGEVPR